MKALQFDSRVTPEGQLALPQEIAREIPSGEPLQVVVMWEPASYDDAWRLQGRACFESAYSPEDEVYERLIDGSPAQG